VHTLKLSPNLRQKSKEEQMAEDRDDSPIELRLVQVEKLNKILAQVVQFEEDDSPVEDDF
jgi:hypothetical protein